MNKKPHKHRVFFAAKDAGGWNSLTPVVKRFLKNKSWETKIWLSGASRKFAHADRILFQDIETINENAIRQFLSSFRPCIIVTGTSGGDSIEKHVIKIAKEFRIPTIAVLDFWINYAIRFSFDNSKRLHRDALSDFILIMDEHAKRGMLREGFPEEKLIITGNPHFDGFKPFPKQENPKKKFILFVDQPFTELIKAGWHEDFGYTEIEVFKDLVRALDKIKFLGEVIVKLHPRTESSEKYKAILTEEKLSFTVRFESSISSHEKWLSRASLVVGMTSILLFEAALRRKHVISYQPRLTKTDPLIANRLGITEFISSERALPGKLKKILSQKSIPQKNKKIIERYTKSNATRNVEEFIIKHKLCSKNIVCIIQARMGSTRLPNKVLKPLCGKALLLRVVDRVLAAKYINNIVVATTTNPKDEAIVKLLHNYHPNVSVSRGSEEDVLDRYYKAAKAADADLVVRVTSDNPMIDPDVIDTVIKEFLEDPKLEYASNNIGKHTYPRGLDAEVITFATLEKLWRTTTEPIDREHVTIRIKRFPNEFKWKSIVNDKDLSFYRWTVDEDSDFKLATIIYERLHKKNPNFRMKDVLELFKNDPHLIKINAHVEQKNKQF
jgi:spore coat polysaccharide biosynthesis protein SpsF